MVFKRPESLKFGNTWHRFQRGDRHFSVQDLEPDRIEEVLALYAENFIRDEPMCKSWNVRDRPTTLALMVDMWRSNFVNNLSIVCFEDGVLDETGRPKIAGANCLTVYCKDDPHEPIKAEDEAYRTIIEGFMYVAEQVDVFQKYGVQQYMNAVGLLVLPEYRGLGLGEEILRARVPLCRALGIKVTATSFTNVASQKVAKKAGFQVLYEMAYEDMEQLGYVYPGIQETTKAVQFSALVI